MIENIHWIVMKVKFLGFESFYFLIGLVFRTGGYSNAA